MFDPNTGLEAIILPFGSKDSYHEWKAPTNSRFHAAGRNECFIDAVNNERYTIKVIAHPPFKWMNTSQLGVAICIDGKVSILPRLRFSRLVASEDEPTSDGDASFTAARGDTGEKIEFMFFYTKSSKIRSLLDRESSRS